MDEIKGGKGMSVMVLFGSIAVLYFLMMIPIEYFYLQGLEEKKKKTGLSQSQMYEKMSFEEEQLHFNVQGNLYNIPSALVASWLIKRKSRKSA